MFLVGWPGGSWQTTALWVGFLVGTYIAAFWLTLVFWTARDIRQRSSSTAVQVAAPLLVLMTFLPGLWLYLVMRPRYTRAQLYSRTLEEEALRLELDRDVACPSCSRPIREDYLVCPACREQLKSACTSCSKPLANAWVACPYCCAERPHGPRKGKERKVAGRALPRLEPEAIPVAAIVGPPAPPSEPQVPVPQLQPQAAGQPVMVESGGGS